MGSRDEAGKRNNLLWGHGEDTARLDWLARASGAVFWWSSLQRFSWRDIGVWLANWSHNKWTFCEWIFFLLFTELTKFSQQHEIDTLNNEDFKSNANWLQMLTGIMEDIQDHETVESEAALQEWAKERDEIR